MKISLSEPGGEMPRVDAHLLPDNMATRAENLNIRTGLLEPWQPYERVKVLDSISTDPLKTIYKYNGEWIAWEEDVDIVRNVLAEDQYDRIYISGTDKPRVMGNDIAPDSYPLGVPEPDVAPSLDKTGSSGSDPVDYYYVWSFISKYGEHGPPNSDPAKIEGVTDTEDVELSGFPDRPQDRNISGFRIYRLQGSLGGDFFFVKDLEYNEDGDVVDPDSDSTITTWTDTVADDELGEILVADDWQEPPSDIQGFVAMPGGFLAGFSGHSIYFSEPWHFHAWPRKYSMAIPYEIKGLGVSGNTLIILTDEFPYLSQGSHPDSMNMIKVGDPLPCLSKRSIAHVAGGVLYATANGIALGTSDRGSFRVLTKEIIDWQTWQSYQPHTINGVFHDGMYFAFYGDRDAGFVFDLERPKSTMTRLDFHAHAARNDYSDNTMYLLLEDEVGLNVLVHWEKGGSKGRLYYKWTSKLFLFNQSVSLAAGKIVAEWPSELTEEKAIQENEEMIEKDEVEGALCSYYVGALPLGLSNLLEPPELSGSINLTIYRDGEEVIEKQVIDSKPFRLPAGFLYNRLQYELEGSAHMRTLHLATSISELDTQT